MTSTEGNCETPCRTAGKPGAQQPMAQEAGCTATNSSKVTVATQVRSNRGLKTARRCCHPSSGASPTATAHTAPVGTLRSPPSDSAFLRARGCQRTFSESPSTRPLGAPDHSPLCVKAVELTGPREFAAPPTATPTTAIFQHHGADRLLEAVGDAVCRQALREFPPRCTATVGSRQRVLDEGFLVRRELPPWESLRVIY